MFLDLLQLIFPQEIIDSLGGLFVFLFTLALLVSSIVQFLKTQGKIPDGVAGKWSTAFSYVMTVLTFIIVQVFQLGNQPLSDAEAWVSAVMALLTSGFVTALLSKVTYLIAKFIGLFASNASEQLEYKAARVLPTVERAA